MAEQEGLLSSVAELSLLFSGDLIFKVNDGGAAQQPAPAVSTAAAAAVNNNNAAPAAENAAPGPAAINYLGKNARGMVLVVNDEAHPVGTDAGRRLIGNIIKAMGLTRDDVAMVNLAGQQHIGFAQLHAYFPGSRFIFFGINSERHGYNPADLSTEMANKSLFTLELDILDKNIEAKRSLWAGLKTL